MSTKLLGAVLILAAAGLFATQRLRGKKRRMETLRALCGALELLDGELQTRLTPLPELCKLLTERTEGMARKFFSELYAALPLLGEQSFPDLWRAAAGDSLDCLRREELEEFCRLGSSLGRYELSQQHSAVQTCLAALRTCLEEARAAYPMERRLGLGLTAAAGILLVVLMI